MATKNSAELIRFVYNKVVEENVWEIEIVEEPHPVETRKQVALNRAKAYYDETEEENQARRQFSEDFGEFLIEVDTVDDEYESSSVDWYWNIGKAIVEAGVKEKLVQESEKRLAKLIPNEDITGEDLQSAQRIYKLYPGGEYPDTEKKTMLTKITYYADSFEEAREVLDRSEEAGFIPMNREVRVWKDVKDEPDIETIAEEVNNRLKSYKDIDKKVESAIRVYRMLGVPDKEIPTKGALKIALEEAD